MTLFKKQTEQEVQEEAVSTILSVLSSYKFNHTNKAIVLNNVALKLREEREEILNDIVTANSK